MENITVNVFDDVLYLFSMGICISNIFHSFCVRTRKL